MGRIDPDRRTNMKQAATSDLDLPIGGWAMVFGWLFG
jgi:hypothetical protein